MKRVLIVGSPGSGKSTLAKRLHKKTGLKLIHLDTYYHQPNWTEPSKEYWFKTVEELVKGDDWIMDGNYGGTMEMRLERSDSVIWLDFPRLICTWRVLKRTYKYRNKTRSDMAEGCSERIDWEFMKYVWNFPRDKRLIIEERLRKYRLVNLFRLRSKAEVHNFLAKLT